MSLGSAEYGSRDLRTGSGFEIKWAEVTLVGGNEIWIVTNSEGAPNRGNYCIIKIPLEEAAHVIAGLISAARSAKLRGPGETAIPIEMQRDAFMRATMALGGGE